MTRKDYEMMAAGFANLRKLLSADSATIDLAAHYFSGVLSADNPRFDAQRFLTACGVER